jgi:hypothetical protein
VEGGGFVVEESPCGSEHQSVCEVGNSQAREIYEAKKLIAINEEIYEARKVIRRMLIGW